MKTFLAISLNIFLIFSLKAQENKIHYNNVINKINLEDQEKPLIFLDFWATWCAPCISSMPHTIELQKQFKDQITFVYLTNEPSNKVQKFLERKNYHFHALIDNQRITEEAFNVQSIPNSFLLNPEGEIIWRGKPTEISADLLHRFILAYKNQSGNPLRFNFEDDKEITKEKWNEFICKKTSLFFYEDDSVDDLFYQSGNDFFLSGDIKYIISFINDYPIDHIKNLTPEKKYRFKAQLEDISSFKKIIKKYLKKNHHYQVKKTETEQEVYYITDNQDLNFMDKHIYNYERGDAQFIQNDISIKIDNATPKQLFNILNNITPLNFIYNGKNKNVYDWNIIYNPPEMLLEQLKNELDFTIEKKNKKIAVYEIINN